LVPRLAVEPFVPILKNLDLRQFERRLDHHQIQILGQHRGNRELQRCDRIRMLGHDRCRQKHRHAANDIVRPDTGQIFGEAGYGFAFGKLAVEPFAGASWVRLDTDRFSEKGGAAALNVAANSFEVGYSTLGARAASLVPLDNGMVVVPRASAAWQHAFNSVTPDAVLAFAAAPANTFTIAGVPIARDALLAEAGVDLAINAHATIGVSYAGQIANNVQDHAAKGRFSWKF
jgi:outer membrane autotransporter protein